MNVISVTWFRTNCPRNRPIEYYTFHWPDFLKYLPIVYPGWILRWHVAEDQVELVKQYTECLDFVELEVMPITEFMSVGHLWRTKPCWDEEVEYCAQNDLDAVPAPREFLCRKKFVESGLDAHVIRDSICHKGQMMGGLCCWRAKAVRELWPTWNSFIENHEPHDEFQYNQWYLLDNLWRKMPERTMSHLGEFDQYGTQDELILKVPKERTELDKRIPIMGGGFDE